MASAKTTALEPIGVDDGKGTVETVESSKAPVDPDVDPKQFEHAANEATELEHNLPLREVFQNWTKAVIWAVLFCVCIIMDGYDSSLITNLYGLHAFQRKYGSQLEGDTYYIPAAWQTAMAMSSPVGRVVGGAIQGHVSEVFGRKKTLIACLLLVTAFIFVVFFAESAAVLLTGQMLCGVVWGVLTSLAPTYASEITPLRLRGILTAYVNLCWSTGQLISTGVLAGMESNNTKWGYRIPFALQWMWPALIFTYIFFAPESPYWLVRKGKDKEAEAALRKLISKPENVDVQNMLALIQRTNEREKQEEHGATYWECFKGVNLRRTEISAMAWSIQILCGLSLPFYAVVFFQAAGLSSEAAFNLNVGMTALGFCGTCISFFLIPRYGRRTLYFGGLCVLTGLMLIVGFLGIAPRTNSLVNAEAAILIIWFFVYFLTVGPVAYVIFSETSSARLRSHTVAIALISYSTLGIVYNVASPYLINTTEANLGAKTGLIYGSISLLSCVWCYFRLPECRGRTFEELDIMFERKVPTREFKDYVI